MSNVLNLHQDDEDRFNEFVECGLNRIKTLREFCDLSADDFMEYLTATPGKNVEIKQQAYWGLLKGLVLHILNADISKEDNPNLHFMQTGIADAFADFSKYHEAKFNQEFARLQIEAKAEAETAHITFNNVSNF